MKHCVGKGHDNRQRLAVECSGRQAEKAHKHWAKSSLSLNTRAETAVSY
jgi:hypothetical protein